VTENLGPDASQEEYALNWQPKTWADRGYTDIQSDGMGNLEMVNSAGEHVIWDHETNEMNPPHLARDQAMPLGFRDMTYSGDIEYPSGLYDDAEEFIYEEADQKDLRGEEPFRQHGIVPRERTLPEKAAAAALAKMREKQAIWPFGKKDTPAPISQETLDDFGYSSGDGWDAEEEVAMRRDDAYNDLRSKRYPTNEAALREYLGSWQAMRKAHPDYDPDAWEDIEDDIPWREGIDVNTLNDITMGLYAGEDDQVIPLMLKNMRKQGSDVIDIAFQTIKTPIVAAMSAFENKHKARQKEEGKMQTAVDRNVRERIARRIAKKRVPKIGADNSSKLLSNRHFEAPIKDENMTPQRQKLASLCDKLKGRGVRVPVKDKKVPSDGIKITKKTVSVSKPKLKISSAVQLFPKKQRTKLAAFLIGKYAEKKSNEASSRALEQFTKLADKGQAVDAPLGSMQQAYVADAIGAAASARAGRQASEHEDADEGLLNALMASSGAGAAPIQERIRHGAGSFAERPGARMMARFDPTQLITKDPNATLTGLIMGTGKRNPERDELVEQRYADVLKKFQDKLDPDAELTTRDTPWHRLQQGQLANLDSDIAGHKYMRSEKPWQYWLNPLDKSGPFTELGDRMMRRVGASLAYPDQTGGRAGMIAGNIGTGGLLGLLTGGETAQQSLRGSAAKNKIYADVADPDIKGNGKPKHQGTDHDDAHPDESHDEWSKDEKEKDAWDKTAEPLDFQHGMGRNLLTALTLGAVPAVTGGTGAVIGALINALRNKDIGRGAMTGGMTGAGVGLGSAGAGMVLAGLSNPRHPETGARRRGSGFDVLPTTTENQVPFMLGADALGMGAGGVGGYHLAQKYHDWRDDKKDEDEEKEAAFRVLANGARALARDEHAKEAQLEWPKSWPSLKGLAGGAIGGTAGGVLGAGGAAGAAIGGLHGLFSDPGEDKEGEKRSRLWRALKGLLGGGALGIAGVGAGIAGGALGGALGGKMGYRVGDSLSDSTRNVFKISKANDHWLKKSFDMESVKKFWSGLKPWQQKSMIGGGAGMALGGLGGGLMGGGSGALYGAMAGGGLGALGGGLYDPAMAKWKEHFGGGGRKYEPGMDQEYHMLDEFDPNDDYEDKDFDWQGQGAGASERESDLDRAKRELEELSGTRDSDGYY
jgi:hypothetical protein